MILISIYKFNGCDKSDPIIRCCDTMEFAKRFKRKYESVNLYDDVFISEIPLLDFYEFGLEDK